MIIEVVVTGNRGYEGRRRREVSDASGTGGRSERGESESGCVVLKRRVP